MAQAGLRMAVRSSAVVVHFSKVEDQRKAAFLRYISRLRSSSKTAGKGELGFASEKSPSGGR